MIIDLNKQNMGSCNIRQQMRVNNSFLVHYISGITVAT